MPYVPETLPEEALELEAPAETAEPLLFALKRLADRVPRGSPGAASARRACEIVLKLDPRGEERVLVPLASPTASAARWLLPLKEHLFSLRLPGAVTGLASRRSRSRRSRRSSSRIGDRPEALAALEGVLARLAVRLGDGALFAAEPVERYRPEAAYRAVPFRARGARRPRDGAARRRRARRRRGRERGRRRRAAAARPASSRRRRRSSRRGRAAA